jgi:uncharacterized membrane protein
MIATATRPTRPPHDLKPLKTTYRIDSIDLLRGIVMVIMALDHTRDFFHKEAFTDDPTNMLTTTPILFFTRWITHFCAPVFVFLSGTSAFLMGQRRTKKQLSSFLITRGLWLVFVELFIITLGWTFNPLYNLFILQVIWAIGISMIILGLLVLLPLPVIFAFGALILFGHNLLDYPEAARNHQVPLWWDILHHGFFTPVILDKNHTALIIYAFVPWTGIMALGYCFGVFFKKEISLQRRRKSLIIIGLSIIALFIILRLINQYGDRAEWSVQSRGTVYTFLSFLNTTKYPPSLMFTTMTLGPAILILAFIETVRSKIGNFFLVYGRVPFFYYVLHFYFIHTFCVIAFYLTGNGANQIIDRNSPFFFRPQTWGFNLWIVYGVWIITVLLLYPLCKWFGRYKMEHREKKWLSYL